MIPSDSMIARVREFESDSDILSCVTPKNFQVIYCEHRQPRKQSKIYDSTVKK